MIIVSFVQKMGPSGCNFDVKVPYVLNPITPYVPTFAAVFFP